MKCRASIEELARPGPGSDADLIEATLLIRYQLGNLLDRFRDNSRNA